MLGGSPTDAAQAAGPALDGEESTAEGIYGEPVEPKLRARARRARGLRRVYRLLSETGKLN